MMPVLDTPITTDDHSLERVLAQQMPIVLLLYNRKLSQPLDDALRNAAHEHRGDLLVVRVDTSQNPDTRERYSHLATPALVTITPGTSIKSEAGRVEAADLEAHIDHLLFDKPLPRAARTETYSTNGEGKQTADASDQPIAVSDATFNREVLESDLPVLVDFWAVWCAPCRSIAPFIEQIAMQYTGRLKVVKLDTEHNPMTAQRYGIQAIPTFIMFKNGREFYRLSGANPAAIQQVVEAALAQG
jgi:thioredoxin 1